MTVRGENLPSRPRRASGDVNRSSVDWYIMMWECVWFSKGRGSRYGEENNSCGDHKYLIIQEIDIMIHDEYTPIESDARILDDSTSPILKDQ